MDVNAQTIKTPLRAQLHARIILALMHPILIHSPPDPVKPLARSELGGEKGGGTHGASALCKVTGLLVSTRRERPGKGMMPAKRRGWRQIA